MGGIGLIKSYINRGQDTLYFQKFNTITPTYYANQYAQNILDSQSIGTILKGYYNNAGLLDSSFIFEVPLYKNMPISACQTPSLQSGENGELAYINANGGLSLRDSVNGKTITYIAEGTQVLITERATSKVGGFYWDRVSTPKGTGYMAREASDGSKTYLVLVNQETTIDTSNNNNYTAPDSDGIIKTEPNTTVNKIKETYSNSTIVNKDGAEITGDTLVGTGAKVKIDGVEKYTIVKLGDVNGDGKIKASDYVLIKNFIMSQETTKLDAIQKLGADVNKDSSIKASDYVLIKNNIMNGDKINL